MTSRQACFFFLHLAAAVAAGCLLAMWVITGWSVWVVVLLAALIIKVELLGVTAPNWPPWAAPGDQGQWRPHL